jgi:prepilin-type N-terminal cleavage/methylation domain-containing protein
MFKQIKNNKGFTLVEVIVVAVIVLILAAVAIPLYNGYIRSSRASTASSVAGTITNAIGACLQQENTICDHVAAIAAIQSVGTGNGGTAEFGGNRLELPQNFIVTLTDNDVFVCHNGTGCGTAAETDCCSRLMTFNAE